MFQQKAMTLPEEQTDTYTYWNKAKISIEKKKNFSFFRERDVVFVQLGKNIGHEQDGKGNKFLRPVLILKKFSHESFIGIPLTSKKREGRFYSQFDLKGSSRTVILSQIRLLSTKRIFRKIGLVSREDFLKIQNSLAKLILKQTEKLSIPLENATAFSSTSEPKGCL